MTESTDMSSTTRYASPAHDDGRDLDRNEQNSRPHDGKVVVQLDIPPTKSIDNLCISMPQHKSPIDNSHAKNQNGECQQVEKLDEVARKTKDQQELLWCLTMCRRFEKGKCNSKNCRFAHSKEAIEKARVEYKTQFCPDLQQHCKDQNLSPKDDFCCVYAHSIAEREEALRRKEEMIKSSARKKKEGSVKPGSRNSGWMGKNDARSDDGSFMSHSSFGSWGYQKKSATTITSKHITDFLIQSQGTTQALSGYNSGTDSATTKLVNDHYSRLPQPHKIESRNSLEGREHLKQRRSEPLSLQSVFPPKHPRLETSHKTNGSEFFSVSPTVTSQNDQTRTNNFGSSLGSSPQFANLSVSYPLSGREPSLTHTRSNASRKMIDDSIFDFRFDPVVIVTRSIPLTTQKV